MRGQCSATLLAIGHKILVARDTRGAGLGELGGSTNLVEERVQIQRWMRAVISIDRKLQETERLIADSEARVVYAPCQSSIRRWTFSTDSQFRAGSPESDAKNPIVLMSADQAKTLMIDLAWLVRLGRSQLSQ